MPFFPYRGRTPPSRTRFMYLGENLFRQPADPAGGKQEAMVQSISQKSRGYSREIGCRPPSEPIYSSSEANWVSGPMMK